MHINTTLLKTPCKLLYFAKIVEWFLLCCNLIVKVAHTHMYNNKSRTFRFKLYRYIREAAMRISDNWWRFDSLPSKLVSHNEPMHGFIYMHIMLTEHPFQNIIGYHLDSLLAVCVTVDYISIESQWWRWLDFHLSQASKIEHCSSRNDDFVVRLRY